MFVDRLQSGYLLFETPQGLLRVDLSLAQRVNLLWTFRHFRQLSVPLLSRRECTLINGLYRKDAEVVSYPNDPSFVIGVVENYVPPTERLDASPAQATEMPLPLEEQEEIVAPRVVIVPEPDAVPLPSTVFASSPVTEPMPATSEPTPRAPRRTIPILATAAAILSLCVISVVAWHRMQAIPASQAQDQARLLPVDTLVVPDSSPSAEPVGSTASPTVSVPPAAQITAAPEADVVPATVAPATSIPAPITPVAIATRAVVPTTVVPARPAPKSIVADATIRPEDRTSKLSATSKSTIRVHDASSVSNPSSSHSDSRIQATRPPLRFAYPDVQARGEVSLTAELDPDGGVRNVRIVSGNHALAAAAVQAVRHWRYRPYLKDGQPVATETNIVLSFFADDAVSMSFPPSIPAAR